MTLDPTAGAPSRSGVRRAGDRFQDLQLWVAALTVIRPHSRYIAVESEITGAGNLDDVVLRGADPADTLYAQVKWAANSASAADEAFFTTTRGAGASLLQKLYRSYQELSPAGSPHMRLISNRVPDPSHPLLGHIDGRTGRLRALIARTPRSDEALHRWSEHLGIDVAELLSMLSRLELQLGRNVAAERELAEALMLAAGLEPSERALQDGLDIAERWILTGQRVIDAANIKATIARMPQLDPSAILSIQAIDHDPLANEADLSLDWVRYFPGTDPRSRVLPTTPKDWNRMDDELKVAAAQLEAAGERTLLIRGAMRQATFFRVGAALPRTRHTTLRYQQRAQLWDSEIRPQSDFPMAPNLTPVGIGTDLAVAIGVTLDPTASVLEHLRTTGTPVGELLTIKPASPSDLAIDNPAEAVSIAQQTIQLVRGAANSSTTHVHLFLAGPGGLALLLGHRWNRIPRTTVYEHTGGPTYSPTFIIDG